MRNSKKIISLVLIGLFLLPMFTITARADGATVVSTTTRSYLQNSDGVPFSIPFYRLSSGETAYGINVGSFGQGGDDYLTFNPEDIYSEKVTNGIRIILMNAPPLSFRQNTYYNNLTIEEKEYAAAVAIWAWILSGGTDNCYMLMETLSPMDGVSWNVHYLASNYLDLAVNSYDKDFFLYAEPNIVRLDTNPDDPNTLKATFTVKLSGATQYFIDYTKIPGNITVEGYTGADKDVLTLTAPISYRGVSMEWEKVLYADSSTFPAKIIWLTPSVTGTGGQTVAALEIGASEARMYANIEFRGMRGSLKIEKINDKDELITSSASFRIRKADNTLLYFEGSSGSYEYTDDDNGYTSYLYTSNGKLTISGLPEGNYHLYEYSAPSGYTLRDAPEPFTISYGTSQTIRFVNKKLNGSLTIRKVDEDTGDPLAGAVFNVYNSNGTIFDVLYTDQDGVATSKEIVTKGKYTIREFFAPQGYLLSDDAIDFTVTDDNTVFDFTITNKKAPHGRISILKLDKDDNSIPLGGAVFGVFRASDNRQMAEMITNAQGITTSHDLVFGSYIVRELSPPYSYSPNDTEYPVELSLAEPTITITVENELLPVHTGKITIMKTDSDSGEALREVEFGVYRAADFRLIGKMTTDATGATELDGIPIGQPMILSETRPAEGYPLPLESTTFILDSKDQIIHFDIENTKLAPNTGSIAILKTEAGNPSSRLEGAVFNILASPTDAVIGSMTSGWSGRAVFEGLPYGDYTLVETDAPNGFVPLDDPIPFTISEIENVVMLEIENERETSVVETGEITILKVDADDDTHVLNNAVFGIYNAATDAMVGIHITGADGTATFSGLPYRDYYLQEIAAPAGYAVNDTKIPFTLDASHVSVNLIIENNQSTPSVETGRIDLLKVDENDNSLVLDGAVFGIYKADTNSMVGSLITGADGKATFSGLAYGDYYLKEIAAPAGYQRAETKYPFTLHSGQTNVLLEVENRKTEKEEGKIRILKRDADSGAKLLSGAVFGVFLVSSEEKLEEITTDANGVAISAALPLGRYYLKEITAPSGYQLSDVKHFVDLTESGTTVQLSVTNKAVAAVGRVKLIKHDKDGKPLSGAVFGIYKTDGSTSPVQMLVSGPDGIAVSGDLSIGSYYLLEQTAPKGYKLSTEKHYFSIAKDALLEIRVDNEKEDAKPKGTLEIYYKHIRYGTELHKSYSYTDDVGTEYMPWVNKNGLDKMPIPPYFFVKADYPSSTTLIDGKLVIVYWYDDTANGGNLGATTGGGGGSSGGSSNGPIRAIPKTGESFPWGVYVASGVLFLCAGGILFFLLCRRKGEPNLA